MTLTTAMTPHSCVPTTLTQLVNPNPLTPSLERLRQFDLQTCPACRGPLPEGPMKAYQTGIGKFISLQREMKARGRVLVDCDAQGLERASAGGELAGGELYDPLPADLALVMQEVIDLYREGAEGGVAASEFDMGNMYMHGCGVEQNYELMMQWWR